MGIYRNLPLGGSCMMFNEQVFLTLAHFCDKHGPRVLMVTQTSNEIENSQELILPEFPKDSYCSSCLLRFPDTILTGTAIRSVFGSSSSISTQYSSIRYQLLTSIVRKTFSEETMSYDSSPFIFYDENRGLNLAVGFKLEDVHARGNERRYCFILSIDGAGLEHKNDCMKIVTQHWQLIIESFGKIIEYIKNEAKQQLSNQQTEFTQMMGGTYLRANKQKLPVNLSELLGDQSIFLRIHNWNTFILRALADSE